MRTKNILAIVLVVLSIGGMFVWENFGREKLTSESVLVLSRDVKKGEKISEEMLTELSVPKSNVVEGALTWADAEELEGLAAAWNIPAKQQLLRSCFTSQRTKTAAGESFFVIPSEWICSRSSALRGGDKVSIYYMPDKSLVGKYQIAFVKDASEQEIAGEYDSGTQPLDRTDAGGKIISGIEIICSLNDYYRIYDLVNTAAEDEESSDEVSAFAPGEEDKSCLLIVLEDAV